MARGVLRVYLGASPGVGKTFAMLNEGHRRRDRGADVVIGVVETHGRAQTQAQLGDLEVVPRRSIGHRGASFDEMDVDAVLARQPTVVLVDELAHTNVPGSRHTKRWQDVEELLAAGIDVVSTLNVQHLESLNDVVENITGVAQRETVPDAVVRRADQIELVDMSPEALRRRLAHGNVYAPERIDAALANHFRPGNLGALRELALLWVADRVDESLSAYRTRHGITTPWETRERVVVGVTGAPGGEALIRRAARIAERVRGALVAVHVVAGDGPGARGDSPGCLARHAELVVALGGTYHEVADDDVGRAVADFARAQSATQVVLGASRRGRLTELVRGSVITDTIRRASGIDVHVIAPGGHVEAAPAASGRRRRSPIPVRRRVAGWSVVVAGLPLVVALLAANRESWSLATDLLVLLSVVVAAGALGGPLPGLTAAVVGSLLVNYFLVPPVHTFTIGERENLIALVVFLAVAAVVSLYVHVAARRTLDATRARAEVASLGRAAARRDEDLRAQAADAQLSRQADELRTGLLRAVSHDLRTPLAAIKASVTSLLAADLCWAEAERLEFLHTVDRESDRLDRLVGNLLDMSRLQAGALNLHCGATVLDDVVASALASLSDVPDDLQVRIPEDAPLVRADPELLERAVANVIGNALAWSPAGRPVVVEAAPVGERVHLRVVDRGPGMPVASRAAAVLPFQRLGDAGRGAHPNGVGLGLSVASGFVAAMGGELVFDDTPGGGLTVVIELEAAGPPDPAAETTS